MNKILLLIIATLFVAGGIWWFAMNNSSMKMGMMDMMPGMNMGQKGGLAKLTDENVPEVQPTQVIELKNGDTFDLVASVVKQEVGNKMVKRLAYNGQIPGPVIKVEKGAKVTVNFTNNLDMETALHSHGLRGQSKFDGAAPLTQDPIPVGGTFTYELEFPDTGVFWYHPHVREDYQQELGLYGNFVVTEAGYWNEVDQEEYLIVDDVLEDGDFSKDVVTNTLMGRFGDTLLINDQDDFMLNVKQGEITRLFLTNVANTRTFDLAFAGAKTKVVGGDNGRIEKEVMISDVVIAPSERYVLEVFYPLSGTYTITHRGKKMGMVVVEPSGTDRATTFEVLRDNSADYANLRGDMQSLLARVPNKKLRLDITMKGAMEKMMKDMESGEDMSMSMGMSGDDEVLRAHCQMMPNMAGCEKYLDTTEGASATEDDGIEWEDDAMAMMNQMSTAENIEWFIEDESTKQRNEDIDWSFKKGELVKIRIKNDEKGMHPMQHPIHFHGQRFVVLARDGVQNDNLQWKDTVLIPKGQTVDLLVEMSNPGEWMAHCHIAEHLESRMMFDFTVTE